MIFTGYNQILRQQGRYCGTALFYVAATFITIHIYTTTYHWITCIIITLLLLYIIIYILTIIYYTIG